MLLSTMIFKLFDNDAFLKIKLSLYIIYISFTLFYIKNKKYQTIFDNYTPGGTINLKF